jgi:hypothetical protein
MGRTVAKVFTTRPVAGYLPGPEFRRRLSGQLEAELGQEHLLSLVGLRVPGHMEPAAVRSRDADVEHLDGLQLVEYRPGRQAGGMGPEPLGQRHLETVRQESQEEVGLDPIAVAPGSWTEAVALK